MDRQTLSSRLARIGDEIPKLENTLSAMKVTDTSAYGKNYEELSLDAAFRAERIACSLRNLIHAAGLAPKPVLMEEAAQAQGISISQADGKVEVTLPGLMPKRNRRTNTTFLTDPLHAALDAYIKGHELPRFRECVVCFSHVFDGGLPARRVRDYDNLECKQVLDTVASFLMTDDSGLLCDAYHTTEFGERDCTVLTIMEKTCFPGWLKEREDREKSISDF